MIAKDILQRVWSTSLGLGRFCARMATSRGLLVLAGVFVCGYAASILWYAQTLPDLGIRSAFTPVVKYFHNEYLPDNLAQAAPAAEDTITQVGPDKVRTWRDLIWAPIYIQKMIADGE